MSESVADIIGILKRYRGHLRTVGNLVVLVDFASYLVLLSFSPCVHLQSCTYWPHYWHLRTVRDSGVV